MRLAAVSTDEGTAVWRLALSGLCATLVAIGLARFAYAPLLPAVIAAGWFTPAEAAYLGAANLAGYLAGALLGRPMAARTTPATVLRAMMVLVSTTFFACAWPLSFAWFFSWRFLAGIAGGSLIVLAAPTVLPHVPPPRRGLVGGAIFTGVGLGIAASGTLVPLLLRSGLVAAWCGLGALALLLTIIAWRGWPGGAATPVAAPSRSHKVLPPRAATAMRALYAGYALNAAGLVPHMVFLVDFVARGLDRGLEAGAWCWVLYGLGAVAGPILTGRLGDHLGFGSALRLAFLTQIAVVTLPALTVGPGWLALSSLVAGALTPGMAPLVLGRIGELMPGDADARQAAWSLATIGYAVGQAAAAYGFSFLFARTNAAYALLFAGGAMILTMALAIDLATARNPHRDGSNRPRRA
jgi:predicted MFS family arabinose efflux permease